jgi:peptidoglycan-N-acetylglucosamine deacetylase
MRVALTFDAEHPDRPRRLGGIHDQIVELLAESGVRATFFLQGRWAEAYPEAARRIVQDGHLVGNHSFYHVRMPLLSEQGLHSDVLHAEQTIVRLARTEPRPWFRCPFGEGWDDPRVVGALASLGYRHVGWHVVGNDWEPDGRSETVEEDVLQGVRRGDGEAVVLLHPWSERTLEALPRILATLREEGATFVGVDELEQVPTEARV